MRDALAFDCRAAGFDVITLDGDQVTNEREAFLRCLQQADAAWIIAPELEHILTTRCQWVESSGVFLLGTPVRVLVEVTDKWQQYVRLRRCGVPVPESWLTEPGDIAPLVRKPRFGAGSWQVRLLGQTLSPHQKADGCSRSTCESRIDGDRAATGSESRRENSQHSCAGKHDGATSAAPDTSSAPSTATEFESAKWLWQRYVPGTAASIACLCGENRRIFLRGGYQILSADGQFRYLGGELPLPPALEHSARQLAEAALAAFPKLRGYVGFDLVLGPDSRGTEDYVIEINPRLTTSYLGQRQLCRQNLAEMLVRLLTGQPVAEPDWHPGRVRFRP
jgi:predicted ATP-grasp superfamily ATP-dependent carboligase